MLGFPRSYSSLGPQFYVVVSFWALSDERFLAAGGQAAWSLLIATEPLQFSSGQPARVTWKKRPGLFSSRLAVASKGCVRKELRTGSVAPPKKTLV